MFSREFWRQERTKSKHIFEMWVQVVQVSPALLGCLYRVHLCVCRLFGASGPAKRLAFVLWSCVPSFYPLCCSSLGALLANMALFRVFKAFLAGFGRFVWVCVVLVRCVACGAFVRVWS